MRERSYLGAFNMEETKQTLLVLVLSKIFVVRCSGCCGEVLRARLCARCGHWAGTRSAVSPRPPPAAAVLRSPGPCEQGPLGPGKVATSAPATLLLRAKVRPGSAPAFGQLLSARVYFLHSDIIISPVTVQIYICWIL